MTRGTVVGWALFLAAAGGVALTQPGLARVVHTAGDREDVYALPPPSQLRAATLGWDAAAVDLLREMDMRHWLAQARAELAAL